MQLSALWGAGTSLVVCAGEHCRQPLHRLTRLPAKTLQMPRADPRTRHRPRGFSRLSSNSPNTMLSFLMETLGFAFRGHFSQFLKHPKVGGLGISSWFLYITDGASIAQHPLLGKREQCRWGEPFLGGLDSLQLALSSEPKALWGAQRMWGGTTASQIPRPSWVCPSLLGPWGCFRMMLGFLQVITRFYQGIGQHHRGISALCSFPSLLSTNSITLM